MIFVPFAHSQGKFHPTWLYRYLSVGFPGGIVALNKTKNWQLESDFKTMSRSQALAAVAKAIDQIRRQTVALFEAVLGDRCIPETGFGIYPMAKWRC